MPSTAHDTYKAILHCAYSSKPVNTLAYNKARKKVSRVLDGCDTGVYVGKPQQDSDLLLLGHHDPTGEKCEILRSLVLTVQTPPKPTPAQLKYIDDQLERAFFDLKKHLGVKQMVGHIHANTKSRHMHILLPNSDGRRGLQWGPAFLSKLQDFTWTDAFKSGRGQGVSKSVGVYPYAKTLPVRDLARDLLPLLQPGQNLDQILMNHSGLSNFRTRKDGSVVSFERDGERIRVQQLTDFIKRERHGFTVPQTAPPAPALPSIPSVFFGPDSQDQAPKRKTKPTPGMGI